MKPSIQVHTNKAHQYKICFILWEGHLGGTEEDVLCMTRLLDKNKYEIHICILSQSGATIDEVNPGDARVFVLGSRGGTDIPAAIRFYQYLCHHRFDLIHVNGGPFWMNIILLFARGAKRVYHERGGHLLANSFKVRLFYRLFAWNFHKFIAISHAMKHLMIKKGGLPEKKIITIHHYIDWDKFNKPIDSIRQRKLLDIPSKVIVVGTIARLSPEKGLELFLQTAAEILKQRDNFIFIIIGDGPEEIKLKNLAQELGVGEYVRFLGVRRDIPDLLPIMDIFLFTSLFDGFGITLLEAMAMKVPIVAVRCQGGISEIIQHGYNGIIVEQRDAKVMAQEVLSVIADRDRKALLVDNGYKILVEKFSPQLGIERITKLYESLLLRS